MPTTNFALPLYTTSDTAELDVLLNGQSNALDTALTANIHRNVGTNAARIALSGAKLHEGATWYATDTDLEWVYNGSAWRVTPGQLLASGSWAQDGAAPTNFQIGVITTPALNSGQNVLIVPNFGTAYSPGAAYTDHTIRTLVGSAVTATTGTVQIHSRVALPSSSITLTVPSIPKVVALGSAGTLSVGMFVATAVSLFGADGQSLAVFSA